MSLSRKVDLKLDWCSYKAAKYAVEHWHYSRRMPDPKSVKVGVWENDEFIGVVMFSRGVSSTNLSKTLNVTSTEIAELSRVALTEHATPVSRIIAIALSMLRRFCPGLRVIVSYADENQGHLGTIYQAGNWAYTGQSAAVPLYRSPDGKYIHDRACSQSGYKRQFGRTVRVLKRSDLERIAQQPKWRYMYPLDAAMRASLAQYTQPYPKRGDASGAMSLPGSLGGSTPTSPLHAHGATG